MLADADEIERNITLAEFSSKGERFDLVCFMSGTSAPNILISQGSGGHAYVFAELGYEMHRRGSNGDSGARRTGFLGEREKRSGVKTNTIPG